MSVDRTTRAVRAMGGVLLLAMCALWSPHAALAQRIVNVPYLSTPLNVVTTMLEMARIRPGDYLIDLGSGDGRIVIEAAKRSGARAMGVDLNAELVAASNEAAKRERVAGQVTFVKGDLFDIDIGKATVITMYLVPKLMLQLRPRILGRMRPGTRVVSHDFDMGEWMPDLEREIAVPDKHYGPPSSMVYLWYVPANVAGKWRWRLPVGGTTRRYEIGIGQRFQELTGEALVDGGAAAWRSARLRGDRVELTLQRELSGAQVTQEFSGRVEGDRIVGHVKVSGGENAMLEWEATRVERGKMTIE